MATQQNSWKKGRNLQDILRPALKPHTMLIMIYIFFVLPKQIQRLELIQGIKKKTILLMKEIIASQHKGMYTWRTMEGGEHLT